MLHRLVHHNGLGRMAEHLAHLKVEGTTAVSLLEGKVCITSCFTDHIERCTLTLGNTAHMVDMLLVNKQAHTLLALIGDDFFS